MIRMMLLLIWVFAKQVLSKELDVDEDKDFSKI